MYLAETITQGGPSAPAWAFFTAISLALIGVLGQQIVARKEARETRNETLRASENASIAASNTYNVSNGFVDRMDRKLDVITEQQHEIGAALRDHLEWHLKKEDEK